MSSSASVVYCYIISKKLVDSVLNILPIQRLFNVLKQKHFFIILPAQGKLYLICRVGGIQHILNYRNKVVF
jgi:hypothetical protein